jgi:hypothetical protein
MFASEVGILVVQVNLVLGIVGLKFLCDDALVHLPIGDGTSICNFIVIVTRALVLYNEHI